MAKDPYFYYGLMQGSQAAAEQRKSKRNSVFEDVIDSSSSTNSAFQAMVDEGEDDGFESQITPVMTTTTSTNPTKPRTIKAGYDSKLEKLIVVFRDGTWWEYRGVPEEMWEDFKDAESKGKYLRESGLDGWGDMGPADVTNMPRSQRVQMNQLREISKKLYSN